jgi:hypothetical protein
MSYLAGALGFRCPGRPPTYPSYSPSASVVARLQTATAASTWAPLKQRTYRGAASSIQAKRLLQAGLQNSACLQNRSTLTGVCAGHRVLLRRNTTATKPAAICHKDTQGLQGKDEWGERDDSERGCVTQWSTKTLVTLRYVHVKKKL